MRKIYRMMPFIFSGIILLSSALTVFLWASSYNSWTLREQLKTLSPLALEINFLLLVVAAGTTIVMFLKTSQFSNLFGSIPKRSWMMLGIILVVGLIMLVIVVPRDHRIYYDEDIYQNIAQNIAYTKGSGSHQGETYQQSFANFWKRFTGTAGMCNEGKNEYGEYTCYRLEYNKQPNAWPYVLSVVFRLFGVHEFAAFTTTNVIFILSIIVVFLLTFLLFNDNHSALYSALIFSFTPEVLIWSNTVAVEPATAFFAALTILGTLVFLKTRARAALFLTVVVSAFAIQFRPESILIGVVVIMLLVFFGRDEFKKGSFYLIASLFFVLVIPHLVHLYAVKDLGWGGSGPKLSLDYFEGNFKVNALFYIRNMRFPLIFTILFFLGLALKSHIAKSYVIKEKLAVFVWFLLFWGIFIFFYAGSYNYGADVRFSVLPSIPIALLAGCGASFLANTIKRRLKVNVIDYILTAVIIVFFVSFIPFISAITQEAWGARADHRFAQQMAEVLPPESVILTHNPNMFLLWGKNAAQASLATEQRRYFSRFFHRYKGGIYFHYNFWCNVSDPVQNAFCKNILNKFDCTEIMSFKEKNYEFALYEVKRKSNKKKLRKD